jgi:hypothetical protein
MTPQLSVQQLEHAIKNCDARVKAKTLECAALDQMRDAIPEYLAGLIIDQPLRESVHNYLTAKLNWALIDLQELELQLKAVKQMSSGVIVPGMTINQKQR